MRFRVKENEQLVRDGSTLAILNTDQSVISAHEQKLARLRREKAQEEEINNIKRDVSEIKDMLRNLLEQRK